MKISQMKPFGVKVTDLDLNNPDDLAKLPPLLAENGIILVPSNAAQESTASTCSPEGMTKLGMLFGKPLMFHDYDRFVEGTVVSEVVTGGDTNIPADAFHFHSDCSWWKDPPSVVLLSSFICPPGDKGHTYFQNSNIMYNSLSEESKKIMHTNRFVHSLHHSYEMGGRTDVTNRQPEVRQIQPGIIRHPKSGMPIPYISRSSTMALEGMSKEDSAPIINRIINEMNSEAHTYVHKWQVGDVIIWDNFGTQHRGSTDYTELRVMRKVSLMGDHPPPTKYELPQEGNHTAVPTPQLRTFTA